MFFCCRVFDAMCIVFFMVCADEPPLIATCVVFVVLLCFRCYVHGFLKVSADRPPLVAICVLLFVFNAVGIVFLIVFADRPPLVAICVIRFVLLCF